MNRDTLLGVQSDRIPLSREQIRQSSNKPDTYVSPHHADGGWHATPGTEERTVEWQPLHDRILVEILPEKLPYELIILPENASRPATWRRGIVLKIGFGKRTLPTGEERMIRSTKPGDEVVIGPHDDWSSQDGRYVICQEEDICVYLTRSANGDSKRSGKA